MEQRHARPSMRLQRTLSKQASVVDDERDEGIVAEVIPVSNGSPLPSESPPQLPLQTVSPSTPPLVPPSISPNTITASPTLTVTTSSPGPPAFTESKNHVQEKSRAESPIPVHNNSNGNNNVSSFNSNQRSKSLDLPQHQHSQDSDKEQPLVTSARHRHGGKLRLQRSHAMRDDCSPPPDYREPSPIQNHPSPHSNTLTVGGRRRGFRHQGSSQGSYESSSPCLSRDSSMEYTDSSGVDLQQFIIQTLHKNQKDRMMLLKIEHELVSLVKDSKRTHHKFGPMSSYQRMLVHRCAAFFGLEHNVDQAGTAVIVNKTRCTRLPDIRFRDHCRDDFLSPDEPKRSILKRDSCSFDDGTGYKSLCSMDGLLDSPERRHDSRRNSQDEPRWHDSRQWNFMDSENHHRKHQHDNHRLRPCRLPKVESFESRETLHPRSLRPPVFKSHSFGGYSGGVTVLARGDSVSSNQSSSRLSKQDSTSSRISDHSSSSGYKTQRQDTSSTSVSNTMSTTPSPTTSHHQQQPSFGVWGGEGDSQPVMWAVTDMEAVPAGAMLINPQSGQPYVNDDGSVYRFDPNNPPQVSRTSSIDQENTEKDNSSEKHRSSPASSDNCPLDEREVPLTSSSSPLDPTTSSSESLSTTASTAVTKGSSQQQKPTTPEPSQGAVSKESGSQESSSTEGNTAPSTPQVIYSHYYNQQSLETKQYSQTGGCGDVSAQLRSLCISGGAGAGTGSGEGTVDPSGLTPASVTPAQHSFIMSRHQYTQQPVYYLPPCSSANGSMKYVYPQYQMAPVGPQPVSGLPTAATMQPVQTLPGMAAIQAIQAPPPIAAPCVHAHPPANPTAIDHSNAPPVGYLPGSYTVVTYPTPGGVVAGTTGTPQESGGTTYYYQVPVGGSNNVNGAPPPCIPPTSLQQPYAITSTPSTTSFPHGLHSGLLYSGGGVGGGGVYPSIGGMAAAAAASSISAAGGVYATNGQGTAASAAAAHSAAAAAAAVAAAAAAPPHPPPAAPSSAVSYRNPTPPQTPNTQMVGGAVATPPPHHLLQFGVPGVPPPLPPGSLTPHPPVFAKPYIGTTTVHNFIGAPAPMPEQPGLHKDDGKRFLSLGGNMAAAAAAAVQHNNQVIAASQFLQQNQMNSNSNNAAHAQLLARPYSIMQTMPRRWGFVPPLESNWPQEAFHGDMRVLGSNIGVGGVGGGLPAGPGCAGSHLRTGPIFLTGPRPRHPATAVAFATTPIPPFNISRPPKIRRQRSRSSYVRSCDVLTPQLSVESQDTNDTI